jgi:hypothetical protein
MKIPKHVKVIGHVQSIGYLPDKHRADRDLSFWESKELAAVNDSNTAIYFFPKGDPKPTKRGRLSAKAYTIPTTSLKRLGTATRIVWHWEEIEETLWHAFEKGPVIYGDRYNKPSVLAIKHARGKIFSERGII